MGIFPYTIFHRGFFLLEAFSVYLTIRIIYNVIRSAFCPPCPIKWPAFCPPYNFDWHFVCWDFVCDHMTCPATKWQSIAPATTTPTRPPTPAFGKSCTCLCKLYCSDIFFPAYAYIVVYCNAYIVNIYFIEEINNKSLSHFLL